MILTCLLMIACSDHVSNPRNDIPKPLSCAPETHFTLLIPHVYYTKKSLISVKHSSKLYNFTEHHHNAVYTSYQHTSLSSMKQKSTHKKIKSKVKKKRTKIFMLINTPQVCFLV